MTSFGADTFASEMGTAFKLCGIVMSSSISSSFSKCSSCGPLGGDGASGDKRLSSAVSDSAKIFGRCNKGKKVDGKQAKNQSESSAVSDPAKNENVELMISPSNFKSNLVFAFACEERISSRDNPRQDNPEEGAKAKNANDEKLLNGTILYGTTLKTPRRQASLCQGMKKSCKVFVVVEVDILLKMFFLLLINFFLIVIFILNFV